MEVATVFWDPLGCGMPAAGTVFETWEGGWPVSWVPWEVAIVADPLAPAIGTTEPLGRVVRVADGWESGCC